MGALPGRQPYWIAATLDQPTSGEVTIHQQPITHLREITQGLPAKEIGFIFQDFNFSETMTAYENIAYH